jgi:glycosyltransferase involved in cell wall biosynthesis
VLVIEASLPRFDREAGGVFLLQICGLLGEAGFRVLFLPDDGAASEPHATRLHAMGVTALTGMFDARRWLAANGTRLEHVLIARPEIARRYLPAVRAGTRARVEYFTQDLHFLRERRQYQLDGDPRAMRASRRLEKIERHIFQAVDGVGTPSSHEAEIIREMAPGQTVVVLAPFLDAVVAAAAASPAARPLAERDALIFVGSFAHLPNVDAVRFLVREILPQVWLDVPHAQVIIAGPEPPPDVLAMASERIRVLGHVPDLAPVYAQARLSVSPLRFGAGVKGKIVASVAAGVPVVTTAIGNEGIGLRDGEEALLADDADGLAAAVIRLYREPGLPEALATAARRAVELRFSHAAAAEALAVLIGRVPPGRTP